MLCGERGDCCEGACAAVIGQNIVTFVRTESCVLYKYIDCVEVCCTDAFRAGASFLAIGADDCIDCALFILECWVNAIGADCDVPIDAAHFTALNPELAELEDGWKPILQKKSDCPMRTNGRG